MPTNLKNLLSRSRSRNELKVPKSAENPGVCSCAETTSSDLTTCHCQAPADLTVLEGGPLRCEISSRSLLSLSAVDPPVASHLTPDPSSQSVSMRKCETVLALSTYASTSSSSSPSPTKLKGMKDRVLSTSSSALSTLLSSSAKSRLFAGWKLSTKPSSHNGHDHQPHFPAPSLLLEDAVKSRSQVSLYEPHGTSPLTPTNRLRRHGSVTNTLRPYWLAETSRHSSLSSVVSPNDDSPKFISCRLCLCDVSLEDTVKIINCSCQYCKDCVTAYVLFEVSEGAYDIACPDATCAHQGVLSVAEIEAIVPTHIVEKHKKFRSFKDVETNCELMWCPTPGCETICKRKDSTVNGPVTETIPVIQCTRCQHVYCTECRLPVHSDQTCDSYRLKLIRQGKLNLIDEEPFAACDSIKKCPFCHVPIEKSDGCAQMMCKRCKHVFCWYCLSSLDDDFLLRHYDKGPCKNKLGHSRASVVWHRTQVIGIFAGFGLLVLLASPLLILAAPCLLCCRCRYCSTHLDTAADDSPVSI